MYVKIHHLQESTNYSSSPVSHLFWNTASSSFSCLYSCFLAMKVALSSCDREFMASIAQNLYYNLMLYRKTLLTHDLLCQFTRQHIRVSYHKLKRFQLKLSLGKWELNFMPPSYIPENIKWKIHMQILVDQKNTLIREIEADKSKCFLEVRN